jgi:hypothetical protein
MICLSNGFAKLPKREPYKSNPTNHSKHGVSEYTDPGAYFDTGTSSSSHNLVQQLFFHLSPLLLLSKLPKE